MSSRDSEKDIKKEDDMRLKMHTGTMVFVDIIAMVQSSLIALEVVVKPPYQKSGDECT